MEPKDLREYLEKLFSAHGISYQVSNEWIVPNERLPAIRATWFPRKESGVFEVEVLLEDGRLVNECFSGIGCGEEGILNGLESFCINSFHVFLSAFWGLHEPEQVTIEEWKINDKLYKAYIGNFGTRTSSGLAPQMPDHLFSSIEQTILGEILDHDIAWFRVFFANLSGAKTYEALKENELWEKGVETLKSIHWSDAEGYYSFRNFMILKAF